MKLYQGHESPAERAAAAELAGADAWRDPLVVELSRACLREAERKRCDACGYSLPLAYLDACLRAVQLLPYVPDVGGDALREPWETIVSGGDCEDLASLLAALVACGRRVLALPVWAAVVWIVQRSPAPQDHVTAWVWVDSGGRNAGGVVGSGVIRQGEEPPTGVWWAETTVRAARGESPYAAVGRIGGGHARVYG